MRKFFLFCGLLCSLCIGVTAQKQVYIPQQFGTSPWNEWSWSKSYQSANFVIFWGNKVGTNPATYSDPNLRFDPAVVAGYLENSFAKFVNDVNFVPNTGNMGMYKIIVVMNETYTGSGGPTGWAFGGSYDDVIGAMWVHPNATLDPYVLSHEFAHSLQGQNRIQSNPSGGFVGYEPAGWFWEAHANYMRCVEFPTFASDDLPRWLMTRHFHTASTRHHYSAFKWLMNIQQNYGGYNTVNNLWKQSIANETATEAWRRLSGWTQAQLNDAMYDYAKREVNYDYPAQGFGADIREQINIYKTTASENWWLWREYTILEQVNATNGRYAVPNYMAPQDYGMNIIPLHPNCSTNTVHVKFRGHSEVNSRAGWRWGFVEVTSAGASIYAPVQNSSNGEATYTLTAGSSRLFLVVMGAPSTKMDYVWEPGWTKIHRYPYELRIENAVPEGFQSNFRADIKAMFAGAAHSNGGGWVASTATVASTVYVGPKAVVLGTSNLTGSVRVEGTARLQNVTASGNAKFAGNCNVNGGTFSSSTQVLDGAVLFNTTLTGNAICKDVAWAWGATYGNGVVVGGDAEIGSCATPGVYLQTPHPNNGRNACDGQGSGHTSNIDINASYTLFTDAQMSWTAIGCGACTPSAITPQTQINGGSWVQTTTATVSAGASVRFGPQPTSGGSWSWTGPGGFTATTREILISNVQATNTGTYIATYTNSCGTTSTQNFTLAIAGGTSVNIALTATAFTSYVSPWETLAAVNDGYTPSNSNDKSNGAYGNWNNPNSTQWVQYDWAEAYNITSAEIYWFNDGGGVLTPTTATFQRWDGSAWVNVGSVPLVTNAFNTLNMNITASRVRVTMLNSTQSTGILEFRVFGSLAPTVTNIAPAATASTSYVSPWETLAAVNDGYTPSNSNDKSNGAYGNWNNPNSTQWVQYDWAEAYNITSAEIYWFNDGGGVLTPTTATFQRWDGSVWVNVGSVPLVTNASNTLNMNITASRVRVTMLNSTQSTGILEFRVFGAASGARLSGEEEVTISEGPPLDLLGDRQVTVFPNPVNSTFTVVLAGFEKAESLNLSIIDLSGREIHQQTTNGSGEIIFSRDQFALKGGVYMLKVIGDKTNYIQRFIVLD